MEMRRRTRVMIPVEEVDISAVKYQPQLIEAPHLTGFWLRCFVWFIELWPFGPLIISFLKRKNKYDQVLKETVIPERPMFRPEYPPQDKEPGVIFIDDNDHPSIRAESALRCFPPYDACKHYNIDSKYPFLYWTIRDYAHAYRSGITTPSIVAEYIIDAVDDCNKMELCMSLLIYFDANEVRKQASQSTQRITNGEPLSILDGIFMSIKDDIDCKPYPTKGATTWYHKVRPVKEDAACVSKLRSCGVVFIGKANMHELGIGTTGNNPNYGTTRNPHAVERYTGGSSSGPSAIVACGLCPASIGTDGGGSVRIPSSLCGVVGLKTNYGRTNIKGVLCDNGTVEVVSPIAATIEDVMLVYAVISGASPADKICYNPLPPCLPNFSKTCTLDILRTLRLGKYTEWFNDVRFSEISNKCDHALDLLSSTHGCQISEIILPELQDMPIAHLASIGVEAFCPLNPEINDGKFSEFTHDTRISLALFQSFSGSEYVSAQRLRRRAMYYHMEAFKKVDIIVTPTTGITAPIIPPSSLKLGESNYVVSGYLMKFILAGNLLGLPAITIPVGHDKEGLPIGIQLIGRPWGEATILRVASAIEKLCLSSRKRPGVFFDVLSSACK
ncbi:Fatty acid amide hydrolase [Zostera marina]|uniref:Fatty acid amide hydrolase n=1 Tax=Zostera marina TaxID=29655 RepID=A0A0K9PIC5_ZOSMR|nr:Fatty acid amide hydrolase [Zostera marina]